MKKFKVLLDFLGSQDGMSVTEFKAGEIVEVTDHLAPHIGDWAEEITDTPAAAADEQGEAQPSAPSGRPQIKAKRDAR